MKNARLIVAICTTLMIAVPAMALDLDVSGHYFVRAYNHSNETLNPDDSTDDYGTMELMVKPVFKINENITLTTQFTALENHVWGDDTNAKYSTFTFPLPDGTPQVDDSNNFSWKAAYMTIKTSVGGFIVGRYIDTPWGLGLGDSTASHGSNDLHKDRIMWVVPVGDFISGAVYQKMEENDKGKDLTDQDYAKAYVFTAYKKENWSTGLLVANYNHKNYTSMANVNRAANSAGQAQAYGTLAAQAAAAGDTAMAAFYSGLADNAVLNANTAYATKGELMLWVLDPYFKGQFGGLGIEAELLYGWGDIEQDDNSANDLDAQGLGYFVDVGYDFGPFSFMVGTTYVQGDWDLTDDESNSMGYFERSIDHERGFLLTSDLSQLEKSLGGSVDTFGNLGGTLGMPMGNLAGGPGTVTGQAGYQMFYVDLGFQVTDNLKLGLFCLTSTADDTPRTDAGVQWDDDHGQEYDFTVEWNMMENLAFKGVIAHLAAGDYWKQGDPNKEIDDNTTFFGELRLTF
jgi:hypothetical protein